MTVCQFSLISSYICDYLECFIRTFQKPADAAGNYLSVKNLSDGA